MNPEPDYRRLLTAIRLQEPDRVPLAELGISRSVKAEFLGKPIDCVLDDLEFWWRACYDYVYLRPAYEFPGAPDSAAVGTLRHSDDDFDTRTMEQVGPICDLASFEACPWPNSETVDCGPIETAGEHLPKGMGIISGVGGVFTRTWMLFGFERFCVSLGDDPELVGKVFRQVGQIQCDVLRRIVKLPGVFAVWYGDDLAFSTSLLVSPHVYRTHLFPWMEEMVSIVHAAGMPFIFHTDGNIWRIMDDIVALGVDALHPVEPKAMDILEVKRLYGKRLALFGNLDLGSTLVLGTPAEVRSEVRELIRRLAPGGGYAVGSSNIVTKYVPLSNFNAMREAVFEYGSYPIDL